MAKFLFLLVGGILWSASSVVAQTWGSVPEAFVLPGGQGSLVKVTPSIFERTENSEGLLSFRRISKKVSGQNYYFSYLKGLNDQSAIAVYSYVGQYSSTYEFGGEEDVYKYSGLGDIKFSFKTFQKREFSNVLTGIEASLSPGNQVIATLNTIGNLASGGTSLTPYLGYEVATAFGSVGGLFSYSLFDSRIRVVKDRKGSQTDQEFVNGGNTLAIAGFVEKKANQTKFGGMLGLDWVDSKQIKDKDSVIQLEPETHFKAKLYSHFNVAEGLNLEPSIFYKSLLTQKINNLKYSRNDETAFVLSLALTL